MKVIFDNGVQQTVFNGILYLSKDRRYSSQFLGVATSEKEAVKDMEETIKKYSIKLLGEMIK